MPDQPDEAQQRTPARRTAAQEIQDLKEELGGYQGAINRKMDQLRTDTAALRKEFAELTSGATITQEENELSDRVTGLVNSAMGPIVESANRNHVKLTEQVNGLIHTVAQLDKQRHVLSQDHMSLGNRIIELEAKLERAITSPALLAAGDGDVESALEAIRTRQDVLERRMSTVGAITDVAAVPMVHAKVLELMKLVPELGKDRTADKSMGGYQFRSVDAAMDAVGAAMRTVGLTLETEVAEREYATAQGTNKEGRTLLYTSARVVMRYTFVCPEDASRHTFEMAGESRDVADKATSKANSMALKYGLLQALMIPVQGTPDGDAESPQVTQEQRGQQEQRPAAPPADSPAEQPTKPTEHQRAERARNALAALNGIGRLPVDRQLAELGRIRGKIESEGLATYEIDGATLRAHGIAVARTLEGQPGQNVGDF